MKYTTNVKSITSQIKFNVFPIVLRAASFTILEYLEHSSRIMYEYLEQRLVYYIVCNHALLYIS